MSAEFKIKIDLCAMLGTAFLLLGILRANLIYIVGGLLFYAVSATDRILLKMSRQ